MAHVVIPAWGTDGDVLPFVTVGAALKRRGHAVTFASNPRFERRALEADLDFVPVGNEAEYAAFTGDARVWDWKTAVKAVMKHYIPTFEGFYEAVARSHRPGQSVLFATPGFVAARIAQERFGLRFIAGVIAPSRMAGATDPPHPPRPLPPSLEWATRYRWGLLLWESAKLVRARARRVLRGPEPTPSWQTQLIEEVRRVRSLAGLPGTRPAEGRTRTETFLCMWPEWFSRRGGSWPTNAKHTGFPMAMDDRHGDEERSDTLVFTRGSVSTDQKAFFAAAADCCRILNRPGVLVARSPQDVPVVLPRQVRHVPYADFVELFSRAAAVVHHAGIGTIACALRTGVPQLATPVIGEQFDLANRLRRLGVARMLTEAPTGERLARELGRLLEAKAIARHCKEARLRMDSESGPARAVDAIENVMGSA